jgi:hypothetical protein
MLLPSLLLKYFAFMLFAYSVSDLKFVYSITNNKQFDLEDLIWAVYCSRTSGTNAISYETF